MKKGQGSVIEPYIWPYDLMISEIFKLTNNLILEVIRKSSVTKLSSL